jgi:hypothetical protein
MPAILEERNLKFDFLNVVYISYWQQEKCPPFDFEAERKIIHTTLRELDWLCQQYHKTRYKSLREYDFRPTGGRMNPNIDVNIVFTADPHYIGAGSGAIGGAKVFWLPYTVQYLPEEAKSYLQKLKHPKDEYIFGIDSIATLAHETFHALGGEHIQSKRAPSFMSFFELIGSWNGHMANFGKVGVSGELFSMLAFYARRLPKSTRLALELMKGLQAYQNDEDYFWMIGWIEYYEKRRKKET